MKSTLRLFLLKMVGGGIKLELKSILSISKDLISPISAGTSVILFP